MLLHSAVVLLATFLLAASATQGDHDDCVFVHVIKVDIKVDCVHVAPTTCPFKTAIATTH